MKAKYVQRGDSVDFIPSVDMEAGEIVRLGNLIGITKIPVAAGTLGTIAISGIFDIIKSNGITFTAGANVFWNTVSGSASDSGVFLGIAVREAKSAHDTVPVLLNYSGNLPDANPGNGVDAEWRTL